MNIPARLLNRLRRYFQEQQNTRMFQAGGTPGYWEQRYAEGGTSGEGSYGKHARFKASVLNGLVARHQIGTVIEFGCGDGNQLALANYPSYIGLDVSATAVNLCARRFENDPSKSFFCYNPQAFHDRHGLFKAELAMSLDVIYHLVEDDLYHLYLGHLFAAAQKWVAVYSVDADLHEVQAGMAAHVKPRRFTHDVAQRFPQFHLVEEINNPYPADLQNIQPGTDWSRFFIYQKTG